MVLPQERSHALLIIERPEGKFILDPTYGLYAPNNRMGTVTRERPYLFTPFDGKNIPATDKGLPYYDSLISKDLKLGVENCLIKTSNDPDFFKTLRIAADGYREHLERSGGNDYVYGGYEEYVSHLFGKTIDTRKLLTPEDLKSMEQFVMIGQKIIEGNEVTRAAEYEIFIRSNLIETSCRALKDLRKQISI